MDLGLSLNVVTNVAFTVGAVAFLLRDILHLRVVAMLAYLGLIYVAVERPPWMGAPHLYWYLAFFGINAVHSAVLFYERRLTRFSPEEEALRTLSFSALDPLAVRRILRRGTWVDLAPGEVLAQEGELPDHVVVLAEGKADVTLRGRPVAQVKAGEFIGEIAFLTGRPATATVKAAEAARALIWPRPRLRRWVRRDPQMYAAMYASIGCDLAEKIAAASMAIAGPAEEI